jgi:lipopolysaccharide biosynthesis glycosyltransferase
MIGVTVGVGPYEKTAFLAAARARDMTGLNITVLDEGMLRNSSLNDPYVARLAIFNVVDADCVMYFDADIVMLKPWNPRSWEDAPSFVAVRDQFIDRYGGDADLSSETYVNSGFFIAQRRSHAALLAEAYDLWLQNGSELAMGDQTALNAALSAKSVPIELLPEEYNFMRYHLRRPNVETAVLNAHYTPHGRILAHAHLVQLLSLGIDE